MIEVVNQTFRPGERWQDSAGNVIQAHGGGILHAEGTYYWYGEYREGKEVLGVSCYSSRDLLNWSFEGIVLPVVQDDPQHDLRIENVLERPKVVYNEQTKQYVMWMHIDTADYQLARAGVAVSDRPTGPFRYLRSVRPNDQMSRDMTLFKDDDDSAWLIFSSEKNQTLHICRLSDDYLEPTLDDSRHFIGQAREAPAVFKTNDRYYMITSGCTGWAPNPALVASATSITGPWKLLDNPCKGAESELTFRTQSTHVLAVEGVPGQYIFMADRWNKEVLDDSRYVWLPLTVKAKDRIAIEWRDEWSLPNQE